MVISDCSPVKVRHGSGVLHSAWATIYEYLSRPTAPADWWDPPNDYILGGRDLLRPVQGTWLGITKQGRIAILTNFREEGQKMQGVRSRGAMANAFLAQDPRSTDSTTGFVKSLVESGGVDGVGGFSLVCGKVGEPLAVVSNRTPKVEGIPWILVKAGQTEGLSNAAFQDHSWPKVTEGINLTKTTLDQAARDRISKERLVEMCMEILSAETLPKRDKGQGWEVYVKELRHSILIPPIGGEGMDGERADEIAAADSEQKVYAEKDGTPRFQDGMSGLYGTQKQTVILVTYDGHVTFVERTLYNEKAQKFPESLRDRWFEFDIER
ncbi:MAG: hypothetical protein Q9190_005278 [Brigantiaea leucoxantha]